jgi:two-component system, LuxR family, response regulator FixJ
MSTHQPTVFVVDDDDAMRRSLDWLFRSTRIPVETYASAQEFIRACDPERPGCLLLDVKMPGMSGLELQEMLTHAGVVLPIIILTGHGDVPTTVQAFKAGAFDFFEKPFSEQLLVGRVREALEVDATQRSAGQANRSSRQCFERLTPRERKVLSHVVAGQTSREIAGELGITPYTVENHRASIMRKMEATTVAALVRKVTTAGLDRELPPVTRSTTPPAV